MLARYLRKSSVGLSELHPPPRQRRPATPVRNLRRRRTPYTIQKDFLQNRFNGSDNIYFTIVAKLVLALSPKVDHDTRYQPSIADQHEHYRFIYSRQQMPLEAYKPSQIESIPYGFLAIIVASIILILLLVTYLFTRKIAPWIARLKNNNLVEDQDQQGNKDDLEIVPPSSDRNQRAQDIVETEDKMK
jgi:hypothetical protein